MKNLTHSLGVMLYVSDAVVTLSVHLKLMYRSRDSNSAIDTVLLPVYLSHVTVAT